MTAFYDTSSLLLAQEQAFKEHFYLSSTTLNELENIKTSDAKSSEVKYKAREVMRLLTSNRDLYTVVIDDTGVRGVLDKHFLLPTNDNIILACASLTSCDTVYSEDLCMRVIGTQVFDLNMQKFVANDEDIYMGYQVFTGDEDGFIDYMATLDKSQWFPNEYLIFENTDTNKTTEMRYTGEGFVDLKLPSSSYVKAKNALQRCSLDMFYNDDISTVAILGGYGSGKTYLAVQMALYCVTKKFKQSQVLGIREPRGEGHNIGFLPGDFAEKTGRFFEPFAQQMGGQIQVENMMRSGTLDVNIPFYMKGTTYNDTVIVVDEAEDLSEAQIRLIGTRVGTNSRIFFSGDYGQSLFNKTETNPLVKMCKELRGNPKFACIYLDEDVRSDTSKMFANLYKN